MKAILIIDKPDACYECPCYRQNHYGGFFEDCKATYMPLSSTEVDDIPEWCPLRPMPERKEVHYTDPLFGEVENLTNIGYNKCLDDLGETE